MHRRSRCAVFRSHMRRARRWTLARERPCWARHCTTTACPEIIRRHLCPRAELLTFPEGWRCTCGIFTKSRRLSRHFPPRLELLTFPDGWRAELLIFPECRLRLRARCSPSPGAYPDIFHPARPCEIFTKPWHQSGHFPPNPRVVSFSSRQVATVRDFHQALAPSWAFFAHSLSS